MRRLFACFTLLAFSCQASVDSDAILNRARQAVAAQLARTANYACVQTIDRQYLVNQKPEPRGCAQDRLSESSILWMRDRLRLDIAVSGNREIYSWHGESKFTSSDVSDVVQTGPISSGNFMGFLYNIFLGVGVQFTYSGESEGRGSRIYTFNYVVPLKRSTYKLQTRAGNQIVPFHGSFSIDGSNYQLTHLQVITAPTPHDARICSAETNINYQMVSISARPSLLPESFVLDIQDNQHLHTISSGEYSKCREFRGESTLHFETTDAPSPSSALPAQIDIWLPAGLPLQIGLRTLIDDRTSYVGDFVSGVLVNKVKIPGTATTLPKGAVVEGIITKLESHFVPLPFQLLKVRLNRIHFGSSSFLLNAAPETSVTSSRVLREMYGSPLPPSIAEEDRRGLFVSPSRHLHLDHHFSAKWISVIPASSQ